MVDEKMSNVFDSVNYVHLQHNVHLMIGGFSKTFTLCTNTFCSFGSAGVPTVSASSQIGCVSQSMVASHFAKSCYLLPKRTLGRSSSCCGDQRVAVGR